MRNLTVNLNIISSTAEHVEFCRNLPRPRGKAKYYLVTDSVKVKRLKDEKYAFKASEIVPETICLQAVGGL